MIACHVVPHDGEDFRHCAAIRLEVFVGEQGVPLEEEMDDLDAVSVHVLALADGQPIGTGRLIPGGDGSAKIGRMAVLKPYRGQGVGSAILEHLTAQARQRGVRSLSLAAQLHAIPFYERFGFLTEGEVFLDAGIEHRWMHRVLGDHD